MNYVKVSFILDFIMIHLSYHGRVFPFFKSVDRFNLNIKGCTRLDQLTP